MDVCSLSNADGILLRSLDFVLLKKYGSVLTECVWRLLSVHKWIILCCYISIIGLHRKYSMELENNSFQSIVLESEDSERRHQEGVESGKFEQGAREEIKVCEQRLASPGQGVRYSRAGVTQSRSIFSHEDSFVYGNPKEMLRHQVTEATREPKYDCAASTVLDLSCKAMRTDEERRRALSEAKTYHTYHKPNFIGDSPLPRSNLEITLVNQSNKKPSITEQLQIAKIQQQQRRSIQQQQKMLQQMRRSLDPSGKATSSSRSHHQGNNLEGGQGTHKSVKYHGSTTSKEEHPHPSMVGAHFPTPQYPYFDPNHHKELPDGHPILPLLDPVYFSALYNAHGFLPPSSPSIAAAFIGTLQEALPKLPLMFPPSPTTNPLHPQKSNENPN